HGITARGAGEACPVEAKIGLSFWAIAERAAGDDAVSLDRVLRIADAVTHVVEGGSERLANAVPVITVAAATRHARDQGGAQQPLAVDDLVITAGANLAQALGDLLQRAGREQRLAPAPPGHRQHIADRRMQAY